MNIHPTILERKTNMGAHIRVRPNKISHAIAYVDTFMMSNDPDECELKEIFEIAHTLSSQEVVNIIKENVRQSKVSGMRIILKEMSMVEFTDYITRKLNLFRNRLMED